AAIELVGDALQMVLDELLDVPLVARLRPATLVVTARLFLELIGDRLEASCTQAVQLTLLAADNGDDRPVRARHDRDERRGVDVAPDANAVGHGLGQRERVPEVVERRGEDGEALGALPLE